MLDREKFSRRLKELRKKRGISTRNLAKALGLKSHGAITQFEKGTSLPALDTIVVLAEFFDVTVDYLIGLTDFPYLIPDNLKLIVSKYHELEELENILNQIIINEKSQYSEAENQIKQLIKGLDKESIIELNKYLKYLHFRQSLQ